MSDKPKITAELDELGEWRASWPGRTPAQSVKVVADLNEELKAYREGGITEEILRRNDGYIKIGTGCVVVVEEEFKHLTQQLATERTVNKELRAENENISRKFHDASRGADLVKRLGQ